MQQLRSLQRHGLIPDLAQWIKGSGIEAAAVVGSSCGSESVSGLFHVPRVRPLKKKKKKKRDFPLFHHLLKVHNILFLFFSHGIQASSVTYTAACGNSGSLTHCSRPGIEPVLSPALCQVLNPLSHNGNFPQDCFNLLCAFFVEVKV